MAARHGGHLVILRVHAAGGRRAVGMRGRMGTWAHRSAYRASAPGLRSAGRRDELAEGEGGLGFVPDALGWHGSGESPGGELH